MVSVAALRVVYHGVNDTEVKQASARQARLRLVSIACHFPFSNVAGSDTAPNTDLDVLTADVGVYRRELSKNGSHQVCYSSDAASQVTLWMSLTVKGMYDVCEALVARLL